MRNRAQATLEFVVTFFIMVILLYSLLILWKKWCDKIIERQHAYSQSRIVSGSSGIDKNPPNLP